MNYTNILYKTVMYACLLPERQTNARIEGLNLSSFQVSMAPETEARELRYHHYHQPFLLQARFEL